MKYTLLEMTQSILSSLSSDEVNSISDTTESLQVAEIIRQKYFDIIYRVPLPEHEQLVQLDGTGDITTPVLMTVPDGIANLSWVKYYNSNILDTATGGHGINVDIDSTSGTWSTTSTTSNSIGTGTKVFTVEADLNVEVGDGVLAASSVNYMIGTVTTYVGTTLTLDITEVSGSGTYTDWIITENDTQAAPPGYQYVHILTPKDFIDWVGGYNPAEDDVETFVFADNISGFPGNYTFYYKTQQQPTYCCIINNYYVIFDSYDNTQDSSLQSSKSMAWGRVVPTFTMTDSFIPNLAEEQFQLLLNEAKTLAFFELKQQPHQLAMQETKRGWSTVQKNKSMANRPGYFNELPNYGRTNYSGYGAAPRYFKQMGFDR